MEKKLWRIFENTNRWLEYAEKKNAVALTFIGLQITAIKLFVVKIDIYLNVSLIFLGLSFLLTILSFFPRTSISEFIYVRVFSNKFSSNDSLIFYEHIAKYSIGEYIKKMEEYFSGEINNNRYLRDLCGQIVINSQITSTKFKIFKLISWLMIIGQIALVLSVII